MSVHEDDERAVRATIAGMQAAAYSQGVTIRAQDQSLTQSKGPAQVNRVNAPKRPSGLPSWAEKRVTQSQIIHR